MAQNSSSASAANATTQKPTNSNPPKKLLENFYPMSSGPEPKIAPCCKESAATSSHGQSSTATTSGNGAKHTLYRPGAGIHAQRANSRLKLALNLVQKSKEKIQTVTQERDAAIKMLKEVLQQSKTVQEKTAYDVKRVDESFQQMREVELGYLSNLRKRFSDERTMILNLINAFERNKKSYEAQFQCKKEQLAKVKKLMDAEVLLQDRCKKQVNEIRLRNEYLEKKMEDKLYLGANSHCGNCQARKRVAAALENQIVYKAGENDQLKKLKEDADKKAAEKERIAHIFLKENERLKFELKQTKIDFQRQMDQAKVDESMHLQEFDDLWKQKLEESLQAVASDTQDDDSKTPSPPTSDPGSATNSSGKTPRDNEASTPVYGANPFAAWAKPSQEVNPTLFPLPRSSSKQSSVRRSPADAGGKTPRSEDGKAPKDAKKAPMHGPTTAKAEPKTPREDFSGGQMTPKSEDSAPDPKKRRVDTAPGAVKEEGESLPPPPPPPPRPGSKTEPVSDEEEEEGEVEEEGPSREWLTCQLQGYENLTRWYRKQLKTMTDDLLYFQGRLEEDTETIEKQQDIVKKRETDCRQIRRDLEKSKMHEEMLRGQLSNLATSVSTYFGK